MSSTRPVLRSRVQFHWTQDEANPLPDFDALLARLQREKRKKIQQERRRVAEQGIAFTVHEGTAIETDEAIPLWTPLTALPLDEMWADDRFWLEDMLVGRRHFIGRFTFDDDTMLSNEMEWLN